MRELREKEVGGTEEDGGREEEDVDCFRVAAKDGRPERALARDTLARRGRGAPLLFVSSMGFVTLASNPYERPSRGVHYTANYQDLLRNVCNVMGKIQLNG